MINRKVLYGYQIQHGALEIVPEEQRTVSMVFTLYNAGASYQAISCLLYTSDIIEAQGLVLEYQYLRNNGRVLGETIFDDGLTAIYDWENHRYDLLPVKGGTILIDCSLCEEEASTGRLRFTCAHELGHWLLHKKLFSGTGENAALRSGNESDNTLEVQANLLGSILLLPLPQVKRCFYQLRSGRTNQQLVTDIAGIFQVSKQAMRIRLENHNLL